MLSLFNTGYGLQDQLDGVKNGIAIVATNNTHIAITSGQYVYIQDNSTMPEGLYRATTNIAANATLSGSNVTAVSGGGLNALNSKIDTFIKSKTFSVTTDATGCADINTSNLGYLRTNCLILAVVTNIATGDTVYPIIGVYRASTASWTIKFQQGNSIIASQTFDITVWYVLL